MLEISKVIKELKKYGVTRELIAHQLGVTTRTVDRWSEGGSSKLSVKKLLNQILNGYKSRRSK